MIYAEWVINSEFHNNIFQSWQEYHNIMFDPQIELKFIRVIR